MHINVYARGFKSMECNLSSSLYPDAIGRYKDASMPPYGGEVQYVLPDYAARPQASRRAWLGVKVMKWHFSIKGISLKVMKSGFRQNEEEKTLLSTLCAGCWLKLAGLCAQYPELSWKVISIHNSILRKARWNNFGSTHETEGDSFTMVSSNS
eukprot:1156013-Pelagomonas_calceolata.AAC.12